MAGHKKVIISWTIGMLKVISARPVWSTKYPKDQFDATGLICIVKVDFFSASLGLRALLNL